MLIWLNGELKTPESAQVNAATAGLTLGWGVFTTIGVWGGRPFAVERHLARLRANAEVADIALAFTDSQLQSALEEVLGLNGINEGYARLTLTRRGDGRWHEAAGGDCSILTATRPDSPVQPLRLTLSPYRLEARRPLAGVKTTSYLTHQWAWREAVAQGFDEAILCSSSGALCECSRANLFWVEHGKLYTPALETGCLPGIARGLILEWASNMGIEARQGFFSPQALVSADEVFITSAATGPRAVASYSEMADEMTEQYAAPGPVTSALQQRWRAATLDNSSF